MDEELSAEVKLLYEIFMNDLTGQGVDNDDDDDDEGDKGAVAEVDDDGEGDEGAVAEDGNQVVNPNVENVEGDYEDGMIFEGEDFSVNFHRNIPVKVQPIHEVQFAGGLVTETVYRVHLNENWSDTALENVMRDLSLMLEHIILRVRENYQPTDLVRFFIDNNKFHCPQTLSLMPLYKLNVLHIMDLLQHIVQSDEELFLDEPLEIQLGVIKNPMGAGRAKGLRYLFSDEDDLHKSKSIVKITNQDNLCLARSIVVAQARNLLNATSPSDTNAYERVQAAYKNIIHRERRHQLVKAKALQALAGFEPDYTPSFLDLPAYERAANAQIVVFSTGVGARTLYIGSQEREDKIYLLYVCDPLRPNQSGHYHPVTRLSGLFGKAKFCHKCMSAYNATNQHKDCAARSCSSCKEPGCMLVAAESHQCSVCNRYLKSLACNVRHLASGVCALSHLCKACGLYYKPQEEHRCGQRKCKVCLKLVEGTHFCYIRAKKPKEVSSKYMFADFEANPNGNVHMPNLVVAQWQCQHCIGQTFRENPRCPHCGTPCGKCSGAVGMCRKGDDL